VTKKHYNITPKEQLPREDLTFKLRVK